MLPTEELINPILHLYCCEASEFEDHTKLYDVHVEVYDTHIMGHFTCTNSACRGANGSPSAFDIHAMGHFTCANQQRVSDRQVVEQMDRPRHSTFTPWVTSPAPPTFTLIRSAH